MDNRDSVRSIDLVLLTGLGGVESPAAFLWRKSMKQAIKPPIW